MFALTIDQRGSRTARDAVPRLLADIATVSTVLGFERTVGDEIQGLLEDPHAVVEAVRIALRDGVWSIGLGIGPIQTPLPASVREASGEALIDAREAVELAKGLGAVRVSVRSRGAPALAADVEAVARLIGTIVERRTTAGWRVVDAVRTHDTQKAAAEALGITQQAVSKSIATSDLDVEEAGYPLLVRLLSEADEEASTS